MDRQMDGWAVALCQSGSLSILHPASQFDYLLKKNNSFICGMGEKKTSRTFNNLTGRRLNFLFLKWNNTFYDRWTHSFFQKATSKDFIFCIFIFFSEGFFFLRVTEDM